MPMFFRSLLVTLFLFVAAHPVALAQTDTLMTATGTWVGSFDGDSLGKLELFLNQDSNQKLLGQIIIIPADGNRRPIALKTVTWQNNKLSASYIDPSDGGEVSFTGTYTNQALSGTWQAVDDTDKGTWQLTRSPR